METANIKMRTCKTCGETKPLETGFYKNGSYRQEVYYRHECKRCWDKAINESRKQRGKTKSKTNSKTKAARHIGAVNAAMEAAIRVQEEANERVSLVECIRATHAACPILGFSLWTGDTPQRMGAW